MIAKSNDDIPTCNAMKTANCLAILPFPSLKG